MYKARGCGDTFSFVFSLSVCWLLLLPPLSTAIWLLPRKYASVFVRIKDTVLVPEGLLGNDLFYILH